MDFRRAIAVSQISNDVTDFGFSQKNLAMPWLLYGFCVITGRRLFMAIPFAVSVEDLLFTEMRIYAYQ